MSITRLKGKILKDSLQDYVLRKAEAKDVTQIIQLMRDMAEFEQLLDQFQADEQSLTEHLFSAHPSVYCLVITHNSAPQELISYTMWFHNYSSFASKRGLYLEDIYIAPAHRRKGLGTWVLQYLAAKAIALQCARFEWVVLDWNHDAIAFYERLGATVLTEWRIVRVTGNALHHLANP